MALTDKEIDNISIDSDFEFSDFTSDSEIDDSDADLILSMSQVSIEYIIINYIR